MHVIAKHTVTDPTGFLAATPAVAQNAPPGVHPLLFCPAADRTSAVCLWRSESLESVREYLDGVSAHLCTTDYFVVDESVAFGLPLATQTA